MEKYLANDDILKALSAHAGIPFSRWRGLSRAITNSTNSLITWTLNAPAIWDCWLTSPLVSISLPPFSQVFDLRVSAKSYGAMISAEDLVSCIEPQFRAAGLRFRSKINIMKFYMAKNKKIFLGISSLWTLGEYRNPYTMKKCKEAQIDQFRSSLLPLPLGAVFEVSFNTWTRGNYFFNDLLDLLFEERELGNAWTLQTIRIRPFFTEEFRYDELKPIQVTDAQAAKLRILEVKVEESEELERTVRDEFFSAYVY